MTWSFMPGILINTDKYRHLLQILKIVVANWATNKHYYNSLASKIHENNDNSYFRFICA